MTIPRRRALLAALVAAITVAVVWPIQEIGWTQKAHYALVRSLADGTPHIDAYHRETGDKGYYRGHFASVKAPGLALVTLPAYTVLDAVGLVPDNERVAIWLLGLLTVIPFALLLWWVTWRVTVRLTPLGGLLTATTLLVGTLVLPFSSLYFSHVPAAAIGTDALLFTLRARRTPNAWNALFAGLTAGLAVLFEYPSAVVLVALGMYLLAVAERRIPTMSAYAAGATAGLLPLLAYNWWAFGSPIHLSYENIVAPNDWQEAVPAVLQQESFGFSTPTLHTLASLLLSERGLLVTTPVVAVAAAGVVLLFRTARRAEAVLVGSTVLVALVWNAGFSTAYGGPFGGDAPGARYLVGVLPFLLVGIAPAVQRGTSAALALIAVSCAAMTLVTATRPQVGEEETSEWLDRLSSGSFTKTPLTLLGVGSGWLAIAPFVVAVAASVAAALLLEPPLLGPSAWIGASAAIGGWLLVAIVAPALLDSSGSAGGALLVLGVAGAAAGIVTAATLIERQRSVPREPVSRRTT